MKLTAQRFPALSAVYSLRRPFNHCLFNLINHSGGKIITASSLSGAVVVGGGTPALWESVSSVEQAQAGHAACIMLSSFVAYDKRSRAGRKVQFFTVFFVCVLVEPQSESVALA